MLLYHFPLNTQENIDGFVNNGMKNDATIVNNSGYSVASDGKVSAKSLLCNGRSLKLPFDNKDKTIAMRLKFPSTLVDSKYLFKIYNSSNTNIKSGPYTWNALGLQLGTTTIVPKSNTNWFDFVMVFTSSGQNAYIDGVLKLTQTTDVSTASYIRILTGTQGSQDYNGYVQDIRIYDYALSQAEINEYSRAMVVHYPLQGNELNTSVLKDVSGFGNDYTLQGTNSYQLDSARGVKSLHTTDTAIYTQTPISSGYTTSFWCKYNEEWKHLCNNGSKYVNGVVNSSLYDTIYATLTASEYDIVDYRVYATALFAEDIKNLYNSPISISKQHQTMAFEFNENPLYPSKYWRTPTYDEMNYIINTRPNAANLRTICRVNTVGSTYVNGCLLLPDDWSLPSGISMTITTENYSTNTYTLTQLKIIEDAGGIFIPSADRRNGANMQINGIFIIWLATIYNANNSYCLQYNGVSKIITFSIFQRYYGMAVRLCHMAQGKNTFSTSSSTFIKLAKSNLQYHCTQHIWRFAEHSYDFIGADNANISDSYNGWIDLFGYGTSGVNYSPTLHTTTNSDYASGDIANTDNDWGVNEIQSYDYNVKNFALNKNGIVQHNELIEGSADGCYNNKLITNELIEN